MEPDQTPLRTCDNCGKKEMEHVADTQPRFFSTPLTKRSFCSVACKHAHEFRND